MDTKYIDILEKENEELRNSVGELSVQLADELTSEYPYKTLKRALYQHIMSHIELVKALGKHVYPGYNNVLEYYGPRRSGNTTLALSLIQYFQIEHKDIPIVMVCRPQAKRMLRSHLNNNINNYLIQYDEHPNKAITIKQNSIVLLDDYYLLEHGTYSNMIQALHMDANKHILFVKLGTPNTIKNQIQNVLIHPIQSAPITQRKFKFKC